MQHKIMLLSKEEIQQLDKKEKDKLITYFMLEVCKNTKTYTQSELLKLLKNVYRLGVKRIRFLNGEVYKVLSTGFLKEVKE